MYSDKIILLVICHCHCQHYLHHHFHHYRDHHHPPNKQLASCLCDDCNTGYTAVLVVGPDTCHNIAYYVAWAALGSHGSSGCGQWTLSVRLTGVLMGTIGARWVHFGGHCGSMSALWQRVVALRDKLTAGYASVAVRC